MPDESTNPAWTVQTSQNDQTATNQSWNDFVLDFWDLGDNDSVTTEEVQVDSSLVEEEKADDGLGFDIDLESDSQDAEEWDDSEMKKDAVNDVSVDAPEEETVNDFDISMDYEWTSEEENEEPVEDN